MRAHIASDGTLPLAPATLAEAGLNVDLVQQLVLKTLFFCGEQTGGELEKRLGLRFGVFESCLDTLKHQRMCEIAGGSVFGGASFRYRITDAGRSRTQLVLAQSQYVGPAPVPLEQYRGYMTALKETALVKITRSDVRSALADLVVSDTVLDQIGPAVNAGHSMFVYGSPGNGKTMLARAVRKLIAGDIAIPYALEVEGNIVSVFDPVNHERAGNDDEESGLTVGAQPDRRWARCRRPLVMVGGELTVQALDLRYFQSAGFYKAPVQLVSNGGVLVVDDFGRQHCSPQDLLNRWIVPLESRIDFLTLQSGQTFEIPFMVLLVFATNLKPTDLADEAFLRRIQYKIYAESPTVEDFIRIFENYCRSHDVPFERAVVEHMLGAYYRPNRIPLRGCQPRDLIDHALTLADYLGHPRRLTPALMDQACRSYFVQDREVPATYA